MRAIVDRRSLLEVLSVIKSVANPKSTLAILGSTLVLIRDGQLTLAATDLEMSYRGMVPAETEGEGAFCLSVYKLYEIVKNFSGEALVFEKGEEVVIRGQKHKVVYSLDFSPAEDFPTLPEISDGVMLDIAGETFKEMLKKTIFAVATSNKSRQVLSGVFIVHKDTKLRMVATDGYRLSFVEKEVPGIEKLNLDGGVIVPYKAAKEMIRIASREATVKIGVENEFFLLATPKELFTVRPIEGEFPNIEEILAQEQEVAVVFTRKQLISALKRILPFSKKEKHCPVKLEFSRGEVVLAGGEGFNKVCERLPVVYDGDPFSIFFNTRYLLEALNAMNSVNVTFNLGDSHTPACIFSPEEDGVLFFVMPVVIK